MASKPEPGGPAGRPRSSLCVMLLAVSLCVTPLLASAKAANTIGNAIEDAPNNAVSTIQKTIAGRRTLLVCQDLTSYQGSSVCPSCCATWKSQGKCDGSSTVLGGGNVRNTVCPKTCGICSGTMPSPSIKPAPTPAPTGIFIGYCWWTWESTTRAPANTNAGIAFGGWVVPSKAISDAASVKPKLPGTKFLSLGGGNAEGRWNAARLSEFITAMSAGSFVGYSGIMFDIEEGDAGLAQAFATAFATAKARGFTVLVTTSHSAPYGFPDGASLVRSFFPNANIDYLGPQLYTTGRETKNDFSTTKNVAFTEWAAAKAAVVPFIVTASLYADAQSTFAKMGVTTRGYVQWAQV